LEKAETWLSRALNYRFKDARLLEQALTHRSAAGANNERLEFLGDAILDVVVSEAVFRAHPDANEGDLSRLRASLVKDASLAMLASDLGLGAHLILGGGERKSGGHRRESILADAIEAIFGAVYLDAGFGAACEIIERAFGKRLEDFPPVEELRDPKTRLQEWLQARGRGLPNYELVAETGEAHRRRFEISCSIDDDTEPTYGMGSTRRAAEQSCAQRMLIRLEQATRDE
jgi:ribonuclease III